MMLETSISKSIQMAHEMHRHIIPGAGLKPWFDSVSFADYLSQFRYDEPARVAVTFAIE